MTTPEHFQKARHYVIDNALDAVGGSDFAHRIGAWLFERRHYLTRGGDPDGEARYAWDLPAIEDCEHMHLFRKALSSYASAAFEGCDIGPFDPASIRMSAHLYHHGGHHAWHRDTDELRRGLAFSLMLHTEPKRFTGGQLEWLDGSLVEHEAGRLVFYDPMQQHRIRHVECWSAEALDGRWSVDGWLIRPSTAIDPQPTLPRPFPKAPASGSLSPKE